MLDDGTDDEIFNDNESRIEMMERINKRKMIPLTAIFLWCVIPQGMRMIIGGNYTDSVSIGIYIMWIVLVFMYIVIMTRCTVGFNRLRKKYDIK